MESTPHILAMLSFDPACRCHHLHHLHHHHLYTSFRNSSLVHHQSADRILTLDSTYPGLLSSSSYITPLDRILYNRCFCIAPHSQTTQWRPTGASLPTLQPPKPVSVEAIAPSSRSLSKMLLPLLPKSTSSRLNQTQPQFRLPTM